MLSVFQMHIAEDGDMCNICVQSFGVDGYENIYHNCKREQSSLNSQRNLKAEELVIILESNLSRNLWPLAIV